MPIVFVHGVSVRSDAPGYTDFWQGLETFLRSTIAPVITDDPDSAFIVASHWGDVAASLAWGGVSRPRSPILGMGGDTADATSFEKAIAVAELAKAAQDIPLDNQTGGSTGGLVPAGPGGSPTGSTQPQRLKDLSPDQLSDLAVAVIRRLADDPVQRTRLALIADEVAHV